MNTKKTLLENESQPSCLGAVMPSLIQEVEKEAYLMINAYGKVEAEKVAIGYAND